MLLERGAVGLRVKDVAQRSGLSPSAVLYYYPDLGDLLLDVSRDQLRRMISLGVPTGPDDEESRLLYELDALTGTSEVFATLSAAFFDRQALLYERVLERGAGAGGFDLRGDAETLARGLVALEDGLGLQVVLGHPEIDGAAAERILLASASAATGIDLADAYVVASESKSSPRSE